MDEIGIVINDQKSLGIREITDLNEGNKYEIMIELMNVDSEFKLGMDIMIGIERKILYGPPINKKFSEKSLSELRWRIVSDPLKITMANCWYFGAILLGEGNLVLKRTRFFTPDKWRVGQTVRLELDFYIDFRNNCHKILID